MPSLTRTSADAGIAMALGLGLLYHAGPWYWASRALTVIGIALPIVILAYALLRSHPTSVQAAVATIALQAVGALALVVLTMNFGGSGPLPYRFYALANILSQIALSIVWIAWLTVAWRSVLAWLGTAGAMIGTVGFAMNAHLRFVGPMLGPDAYVPPDPWCSTRSGECGPVDMLSRVAPDLVTPEAIMAALFIGLWLVFGLRPRLKPS
jgi:hypothetical protein